MAPAGLVRLPSAGPPPSLRYCASEATTAKIETTEAIVVTTGETLSN